MFKKLALILTLLFLIGCSNVSTIKEPLTPKEQLLINNIYSWDLESAKETLQNINSTLDDTTLKKYQSLISEKEAQIRDLSNTINILKEALSKNQFFIIERYTDTGLKNKVKLNEMKKADLRGSNIFSGEPVFSNNIANVLTVINFYDQSFYLDIFFSLKDGIWKIVDFNERR